MRICGQQQGVKGFFEKINLNLQELKVEVVVF
jgi:hypothetical protein